MSLDEIIKMAREAGTPYVNRHYPGVTSFGFTEDALQRFVAAVAAAEREACAKVCEHLAELNRKGSTDSMWEQEECAAAIRARGDA